MHPPHVDLAPDEVRAALERIADWIGRYLEDPGRFPVLPDIRPGEIASQLPAGPP